MGGPPHSARALSAGAGPSSGAGWSRCPARSSPRLRTVGSMGRRMIRPGAAPSAPWRYRDARDDYGQSATPDWRDTDWKSELKNVDIDGTPVNYVDVGSGDGEPVVLVHGLGGQWQNWLENLPRLARDRRGGGRGPPGLRRPPG